MTASTLHHCSHLVVNNMKEFSTQVPKRLKTCLARLANHSQLQHCYHPATSAVRCMLCLVKQSISRSSYCNLLSHSQVSSVHDSVSSNWWLKGQAGGSLLKQGGAVAPVFVQKRCCSSWLVCCSKKEEQPLCLSEKGLEAEWGY